MYGIDASFEVPGGRCARPGAAGAGGGAVRFTSDSAVIVTDLGALARVWVMNTT
jgi:hypothetical protein